MRNKEVSSMLSFKVSYVLDSGHKVISCSVVLMYQAGVFKNMIHNF